MTIIVTGCQRSGTTIASHILANAKQYVVLEDSDWMPSSAGLKSLRELLESGRDRLVIQSPAALNNFHFIYHMLPQIQWIGVKRDKNEIIASMKRVKWMQDDYPDYLPFYKDHIRFMNTQLGLLKQLIPETNYTEVNFSELKEYPEFIPKNQRKDFTIKQTRLNEPKGPRYWLNDEQGWKETYKTTDKSSELPESEESN